MAALLLLLAASAALHPLLASASVAAAPFAVPGVPLRALEGEEPLAAYSAAAAALRSEGVVAVRGVPGLAAAKRAALESAAACARAAPAAKTTALGAGASRRTVAAVSAGLSGSVPFDLGFGGGEQGAAPRADGPCGAEFEARTSEFRALVSRASAAFAGALEYALAGAAQPLLASASDPHRAYATVRDVLEAGEHLEHFHAYEQGGGGASWAAAAPAEDAIEMHADQGLFIAFTPAVLEGAAPGGSGELHVELRSGERAVADFGPAADDSVVFMLGDGMDRYVNGKLGPAVPRLRPTPHAMVMPEGVGAPARLWYGRMFMPPDDGLDERRGRSIGDVRREMIKSVLEGGGVGSGAGCSRRMLEEDTTECADNEIYCWMRCMKHTEEASPSVCAAKGLGYKCTSQRDQVWRDLDSHGDYNPACTNSTEFVSDPPKIPAREGTCDGFAEFAGVTGYKHSVELQKDKLFLMWDVDGDSIRAKVAYDGIAGWLAVGLTNKGGGHNGMNGAHIVMGVNDPDPDVFGAPYVGTGVHEYIIHDQLTAFRHWSKHYSPEALTEAEMTVTSCHTSMQFTTKSISGWSLDVTAEGASDVLWAIHTDTFLKGYHGFQNRGLLEIDWDANGHVKATASPHGGGGHDGHDGDGHADDDSAAQCASVAAVWLVLMTTLFSRMQ